VTVAVLALFLVLLVCADLLPTRDEQRIGLVAPLR
jgi:hypothetical protein